MNKPLSNIVAALLVALLLLPATLLETPLPAFADPVSEEAAPSETDEPSEGIGTVYLIVVPNLTWSDITNDQTPTLQYLAGNYACANIITESKVDIYGFVTNERFHYMRINAATPKEIDEHVAEIYSSLGSKDSLIVTSSPSLAKIQSYSIAGYGMLIMVDAGDNGLLTSSTVRRSGLITSGNVGMAIEQLLIAPQRHPANLSVFTFTSSYGAIARTSQLARDNSIAVSIQDSQSRFIALFLALIGITLMLSAVLLFLDVRIQPAFLEHFLPAMRILWIIVLAFPLATYLMFLQLPSLTNAEITFDFFAFMVMEISFLCIIVALVFRWSYSLLLLLGGTVATLLIDQLLGGPMTVTGYLSYAPIEATRYYGIGNEGASLLFGSWIMLSALLLNRAREGSNLAHQFKTWIFPTATFFMVLVIAAPWWGANFGVIIWGVVGAVSAWAFFNDVRITWKHVVALTLAAAAMAFLVLVLDSHYNGESHMGTTADSLSSGWGLVAFEIIVNMLRLSWDTVVFSPVLSLLFVVILGFLIALLWKKPGPYAKFWEENAPFRGGFTALLITSIIMLLVEDSGILMPALLMLYLTASLLWLVCNRHSWHIRKWIRHRVPERIE